MTAAVASRQSNASPHANGSVADASRCRFAESSVVADKTMPHCWK